MRRKKLKTLKRSILVHREQLIMCKRIICSSVKHVSLCSQTVELLPLCFCTCNKDLFCMKSFFSVICEAFSLVQIKVSFVFILSTEQVFDVCTSPWLFPVH